MSSIEVKEVNCMVRNSIPEADESISDVVNIPMIKDEIKEVNVYERDKESCPFNRGNWMIDIFLFNGQAICIKLPLETPEERVKNFILPLTELLEDKK